MIKLMIIGRRRGGMTIAQLQRYLLETHGAMVVRMIGEQPELTPRRYVQNHVFDGSTRAPGAAGGTPPDPFASSRDLVTQVWFDDPAHARSSVQAPFYLELLRPDEDRFVDQTSVVKLPVTEQPVFGPEHAVSSSKLFVVHRRRPGVEVKELAAASLALWAPLLSDEGHGVERLVRNTVLALASKEAPADLIDEVWLRDDRAAAVLAARWQDEMSGPPLAELTLPGFVLLAREHVLFAGAER